MLSHKPLSTIGKNGSIWPFCGPWASWACSVSVLQKNTAVQAWTLSLAPSFTRNCRHPTPAFAWPIWLTPCSLSTTLPSTVTKNRKPEFSLRYVLGNGLVPWPCQNPTLARMCSASPPPPFSKRTGHGNSTDERCGSPTAALTNKARLLTWFGCMPERVPMTVAVFKCRPSS